MTAAEYTTALTILGLTTEQAAKWLGIGRSTAFRYAVDGAPGPVARALGTALMNPAWVYDADTNMWTKSYDHITGISYSDLTAAVGLPD